MSKRLASEVRIDEGEKPTIHIATNNVLAYLQLWLIDKVFCSTFPWGPPVEDTYGTLYGKLINIQKRSPTYSDPVIDYTARKEIDSLNNAFLSLTKWQKPVLILSTVSGLQMSDNYEFIFDANLPDGIKKEYEEKIKKCKGPHVGSYHNMVYKRFLYELNLPVMFFITGDKIDSKIRAGTCHFVFDSEFTWKDFYQNHPIAFCVGCNIENKKVAINYFRDLGFEIVALDCCKEKESFIAQSSKIYYRF